MLTAFGRFVRKLRIDKGCLLKEMADYLDVTASYLSAVEMGKRRIPTDWEGKLVAFFKMDGQTSRELRRSIQNSLEDLQINLSNVSAQQRELAFVLARKLDGLDTCEAEDIFNVFRRNKAVPLSYIDIQKIVNRIREDAGLANELCFPIAEFIEEIMPRLYEDFRYECVDELEMPDRYAESLPEENLMRIRMDVYENALRGIGRDRFTLAHEVGHFILHGKGRVVSANDDSAIPTFRDPEWQANTFAGELLAPSALIVGKDAAFIANACQVSLQVAEIQLSKLR